jgi:ABC-type sugar transport system substrate-binding protein
MTAWGNEPVARKKWPNLGYVGADDYNAGVVLGGLVAAGAKERGKTSGIVLSENTAPGSSNLEARFKGIRDAFKSAGLPGLKLEIFASDSQGNPTQAATDWSTRIKQAGDQLVACACIIGDDTAVLMSVLKKDKEPGEIPVWGIDLGDREIGFIKDGYLLGTVDGQFYLHGWLAAANAWASIERANVPPTKVETGGKVVDKENVNDVEKRQKDLQDLVKEKKLA